MPRPGPRRRNVGMKLSEAGIRWLADRAIAEGFVKADGSANTSAFLRLLCAWGQSSLPVGWRPPGWRP